MWEVIENGFTSSIDVVWNGTVIANCETLDQAQEYIDDFEAVHNPDFL